MSFDSHCDCAKINNLRGDKFESNAPSIFQCLIYCVGYKILNAHILVGNDENAAALYVARSPNKSNLKTIKHLCPLGLRLSQPWAD